MAPSPSQMSDHSLVFRLLCHHIFHTGPSHNWACVIISYHIISCRISDHRKRWKMASAASPLHRDTHVDKPHSPKHPHLWSYGTGIHADGRACAHFYTSCLHQVGEEIVIVWQVRWCVFQHCPMMFVSTARGFFFDETKDALEPAVSHLQVTSKIRDASTNTCLWSALLASIWRIEHKIFRFFVQPTGKMFGDTEQDEETQHHVTVLLMILANKRHISSLNRSCGNLSCKLWHLCKNLITTCKLHNDNELEFNFLWPRLWL